MRRKMVLSGSGWRSKAGVRFRGWSFCSKAMARRESGTSRLLPFFVFGRWMVRRSRSMCCHVMPQISPALMAVSIANKKAKATRCFFMTGTCSSSYSR